MSSPRSLVLLLVLALLAAGCGSSSDDELLTARDASRLEATVDEVDQLVDDDKCSQAREAALKGSRQAQELPRRVSQDLQRNLVEGFEHLAQQVEQECRPPEKKTKPTPEPTPEPTETPEPTPDPTETPAPTPEPTPEPTATAPPVETPDSGGASGDPLEEPGA